MNQVIALVEGAACVLEQDPWLLVAADAESAPESESEPYQILPLAQWKQAWKALDPRVSERRLGVWLSPDEDPALLAPWINQIPLIALAFDSFRDGRAYSQAYLLRSRYGYEGELRATGDVLRDQLAAMRHCGFSSFAVRADKSVTDALKGLQGFDQIYARSVVQPEPLFRRRVAEV